MYIRIVSKYGKNNTEIRYYVWQRNMQNEKNTTKIDYYVWWQSMNNQRILQTYTTMYGSGV